MLILHLSITISCTAKVGTTKLKDSSLRPTVYKFLCSEHDVADSTPMITDKQIWVNFHRRNVKACHYETKICEKSMKDQKSLKNQWNFTDFSLIFQWFIIFHRFLSPSVCNIEIFEKCLSQHGQRLTPEKMRYNGATFLSHEKLIESKEDNLKN